MNAQALGGALLVTLGAIVLVLWYRGYFADQVGRATGVIGGGGKQPFAPDFGQPAPEAGRTPGFGNGKAPKAH